MQDSLPAGGLRLYREGVEPSGPLRKVSGYIPILLSRTSPVARAVYVIVGGREVKVVLATHEGREYLKTEADGYAPNNLPNLPECPEKKGAALPRPSNLQS